MTVIFFFRNSGYSIEQAFFSLVNHYNTLEDFKATKKFLPHKQLKLTFFFLNLIYVFKNKNQINHITGDIHYAALVLPRKNTILTIHDCVMVENNKGFKKYILKLLWLQLPIKHLNYITTISEKSKNDIVKYSKCDPDKIKVIPNPYDENFKFTPKEFNYDSIRVLHFCHSENKNTLKVIQSLTDLDVKIILIGKIDKGVKDLLFKYKVNYENYFDLTQDQIIEQYINCDIVMFPSVYEGFGMPIIEGQAIGRCVITSDLEPMKSVAGEGAFLVDPFEVSSIRNGLKCIIESVYLREKLIANGLKNVERFNVEKIAQEYTRIYQEIINEKN